MKIHTDQTQVVRSSTGDFLILNRAVNGAWFLGCDNVAGFLNNPSETRITRLLGFGYDVASLLPTALRRINPVQNPVGIGEAMSIEFLIGPGIRVLYCSDSKAVDAPGLSRYDMIVTPDSMRAVRANYVHVLLILGHRHCAPLPVNFDEMATQLRDALA